VVIAMEQLTKAYRRKRVVDCLTCRVEPGRVTGFVGPNGAGKTTTMKMLTGLARPTSGQALIGGRSYRDQPVPLRAVGIALETRVFHRGRTLRAHLQYLAASSKLALSRADEVLELVGLTEVAARRAGTLSLGMAQRLALATALLGDPAVLILDEPMNGLDPAGIVWLRTLLRSLASEGRTVLVSSHLMNEMAVTADHVLIIGRGRLIADSPVKDLVSQSLRVRTAEPARLAACLTGTATVRPGDDDHTFFVAGCDVPTLASKAAAAGIELEELAFVETSLEAAFLKMTGQDVEYDARQVQ
jgi:ABC-2 type transport system ATP-binding protein